jgi:predicted phosphodiesterase
MKRWLLVGDVHAVPDELEDCRALVLGIQETIKKEHPDYVVFLGDQFHSHAILRVEVLSFWREAFTRLSAMDTKVLALVGNHDRPADISLDSHALMGLHGTGVEIVDGLRRLDGCLLIPYRHSGADFVVDIASAKEKIVLCHQTIDGAKYDDGFFAPDGVDLTGFEDRQFISGHIHTPQRFGNVTYIGSPRWRGVSDLGVEKGIAIFDLDGGEVKNIRVLDTSVWCRKLVLIQDRQENPVEPVINPRWKYIVEIHGNEDFIKTRRPLWAGCSVRAFKTQSSFKRVRESIGVQKAMELFVDSYVPRFGTDKKVLQAMVSQRVSL